MTAFFARRCHEPQQVADLTSQTFVEAIKSAGSFQGHGTPRAWLPGPIVSRGWNESPSSSSTWWV
ncbi:MAG TPA: hypothetical protein VHW96_20875 [Solirubrobacteraceae bacterium]|nr:hypothetical protein [Solirubrobacteraceae bacterium]